MSCYSLDNWNAQPALNGMNDTIIHLALVDDWELSGSGSGDPHELQFRPMRKLSKIYNSYGIRASFNAEVMQQLAFRELQTQHPHLKTLADEWDETIQETFRQERSWVSEFQRLIYPLCTVSMMR